MDGDERLRLFLALRLPDDVVASIAEWQERELHGRLVPPGNLHITLAFLGSRPAGELPTILCVFEDAVRDAAAPSFEVVRWRERRAAGMSQVDVSRRPTALLMARISRTGTPSSAPTWATPAPSIASANA